MSFKTCTSQKLIQFFNHKKVKEKEFFFSEWTYIKDSNRVLYLFKKSRKLNGKGNGTKGKTTKKDGRWLSAWNWYWKIKLKVR